MKKKNTKKRITLHNPLQCLCVLGMLIAISITVHADPLITNYAVEQGTGQLYLYGEIHSEAKILERELELWQDYYTNQNVRHLFVEMPYYTAQFLNLWMKSDSDEILDEIHADWEGTASHTQEVKNFYKKIKELCPETIFHGTDVGHQYDSIGKRYLQYLEDNQMMDSQEYQLAKESVEQGRYYYSKNDDVYRENKMVENLIREYEELSNEDIMGIYGNAHIAIEAKDYATNSIPCMANQLSKLYKDRLFTEDLAYIALDIEPISVDAMEIKGKSYEASYFGQQDMTFFSDQYLYRDFWRLENAYDDFKDCKKTWDVLPYNNYPMLIEVGQVFVIEYTMADETKQRMYYISTGKQWQGQPVTEGIAIE